VRPYTKKPVTTQRPFHMGVMLRDGESFSPGGGDAPSQPGGRDEPGEWKSVRKGWFLGAAGLKEQLLEQMETQMGAHHGGTEKRETDEQKAERMVARELSKRHWTEEDLKQRRKTDATKVKLALRLRRETMMTLDWIAERLHLGCRHTLANCFKAARINNSRD
jgi:hypothetical protein